MQASLGCAPLCCIMAVAPLPGQQTPAPLGAPGIYLVLLRRSRFDDLPTGLFNIRGKVIGKLRDQMRADLDREKATAEQALDR